MNLTAEASRATSTHAEVMEYIAGLQALGRPELFVTSFGRSPQGRELPLLVLSADDRSAVTTAERVVLAERLAGWAEQYPDVPVTQVLLQGPAAAALVRRSEHAQLVVVGAHGRGNLSGMLLGSVSQAVLRRAQCPVAVVRPATGR